MLFSAKKGISLISVVVALALIGMAIYWYAYAYNKAEKQTALGRNAFIAETYATELLELLRAHNTPGLLGYLQNNPFLATCPTCTPYLLCSHINLLDRTSVDGTGKYIGSLLNEDPLAELPHPNRLDGATKQLYANRFYQIQVVNPSTLALDSSFCTKQGDTALGANQNYQITVGVSWIGDRTTPTDVHRVVLTTVIP